MKNLKLPLEFEKFLIKVKYKSFTVWQITTILQICIVVGLLTTISFKAYQNHKLNNEIIQGKVAGASTGKYTVPQQVNITIEDITRSFNPIDFNFKYVEVSNDSRKSKIIKTIRSFVQQTDPDKIVVDKYLNFDQAKFTYWLKANFATLEEEVPLKPEIKFFENSTQISECISGYSTKNIPVPTIMEDLKNYKQLPEDLYFLVDVGVLAEDEQKINNICNQITEFKRNLKKVKIQSSQNTSIKSTEIRPTYKTYDFINPEDAGEIFGFYLNNNELVIKIAKKDLLRSNIEKIKTQFDQRPDTKQLRLDGKLIIVGEEKEIILINTEESIRVAENLLSRKEPMDNFPIIVEKNDGIFNNDQILKFPKKLASGEVKIPTTQQQDAIRMSEIIDLYNGHIINPGEIYSFNNHVSHNKLGKYLNSEIPITFNTSDEKVEFYKSLEPLSSLFFRLALNSGLPFIERYQNVLNRNISHFAYPVSEIPLVNITGKATKTNTDTTTKEREIDLKFANPSDQPIILLTSYEFAENNEIILKAEIYTTQQFNSVNIQLKDFQKDKFNVNDTYKGSFVVFNRLINDKRETYSIYYYD